MIVQVIGSGCPTCKKLYEVVQQVAADMPEVERLEYVTGAEGMQTMVKLGALSSPVLTVNGRIVMTGFSADKQKIRQLLVAKQ